MSAPKYRKIYHPISQNVIAVRRIESGNNKTYVLIPTAEFLEFRTQLVEMNDREFVRCIGNFAYKWRISKEEYNSDPHIHSEAVYLLKRDIICGNQTTSAAFRRMEAHLSKTISRSEFLTILAFHDREE